MGQSQPTVSRQADAFQAEFAAFRANLPRREQAWFDTLVVWTRRHGNSLNVSEDLDFTRRVLLVGLVALADATDARLKALEERTGLARLPLRRLPEPELQHDPGLGQGRPADLAAADGVPADLLRRA